MSYLSDEQIYELRSTRTTIADNPWFAYADAAMDVSDLYEAHLKEKDALLRKAVRVMTGVDKWMRLQRKAIPIEALRTLLSRINTHLTSNPT